MRAMHGNTPHRQPGDWARQNKLPLDTTLHIGTINTNGIAIAAKRMAIQDSELDIIGLTETHLQSHLHAAYREQWKNFHCFYTPDPDSKHYSGAALLFRKSKFWKVSQISWSPDNPCHKFSVRNRLIASQAWFGHGGCSLIVYNIYAPSGSRWEDAKRRQLYELIDAVTHDCVARGQVPAIVMGDFNMPIDESPKIASLLQNRTWCDARTTAKANMLYAPTCHVGPSNGSILDHVFTTASLYDLLADFQVLKIPTFKDHSQVSIRLRVPQPSQTRMSLRKPTSLDDLKMPSVHDSILHCPTPEAFSRAIDQGDVNAAYRIVLRQMNDILQQIAQKQNLTTKASDHFRGRVQFHEQRRHPPAVHAHASTLQTRKIFKAYNRAMEVSKAQPGYRRDRTWEKIESVTMILPEPFCASVAIILQLPASHDNASKLATTLDNALHKIFQEDNSQRLKKWNSDAKSYYAIIPLAKESLQKTNCNHFLHQ